MPRRPVSGRSSQTTGPAAASPTWGRSLFNWSVTVISLALLVYWVPLKEAWHSLTGANLPLLLLAAAMTFFNIALRGVRWIAIIGLSGRRPGDILVSTQLCAMSLGFNAILPAKAGEIIRIGLARHHLRLTMGNATQAAVVEKLIDMVALLALVAVMLELVGLDGETARIAQAFRHISSAALVLAVLLAALAFPRFNRLARGALYTVLSRLRAARYGRKALRFLHDFGSGVRRMTAPELALISLLTPVIWLILGIGGYILALAMPEVSLSLPIAVAFIAATVLIAALPSAPGAWGVFEAGGLVILLALVDSVATAPAASFVLSAHLIQYIPVVVSAAAAWLSLSPARAS